ncbi:hypothetical protein [Cohnella panacarvi]|uniref:hypothetical protein n=1 Tax=Cohnella panacarvi TaxID=400776 RepID=UPI00047E442B|nr:hypothetical protein [Cohnella panacarvi]
MKLEVNTIVAKEMFKVSPNPKGIPPYFYHITNRRALSSIMKDGIRPHEFFGEVYFCETAKDACMFAKTYRSHLITVDTSKLDQNFIRISLDHNRKVFEMECYRYFKTVPVEAIVRTEEILQKPFSLKNALDIAL